MSLQVKIKIACSKIKKKKKYDIWLILATKNCLQLFTRSAQKNRIRLKEKGISRRWEMTLVRNHRRGNPQTLETAQGVVNNSEERRGTSVLMASSRSNASNKLPASILYKRTYCNVRKLKIDRRASPRLPFSPNTSLSHEPRSVEQPR